MRSPYQAGPCANTLSAGHAAKPRAEDGGLDRQRAVSAATEFATWANRHLVLRSTSHLPLSWRRHGIARVDWTWAFVLVPPCCGTRLVCRWRGCTSPWWLTLGTHALVLPADFVMLRDMLRGLSLRVAQRSRAELPERRGPETLRAPNARDAH